MNITAENLGKRFRRNWVFRNFNLNIPSESQVQILGGNGSGKSTLLGVLSGFTKGTEGTIAHTLNGKAVILGPKVINIAAPYVDLFEQLSVKESIEFHLNFKGIEKDQTANLLDKALLSEHSLKRVSELSSGMKQRLKLTLAIATHSTLLCLDEPCSNLDKKGIQWYRKLLSEHSSGRTILIATNDPDNEVIQDSMTVQMTA
ncbi:MAG: ATP-binding cassette domain-containing protein [Bacteroidota bacterium]